MKGTKARIVENAERQWRSWDVDKVAKTVAPGQARFSRGFLRADFTSWFRDLRAHWVPFFQSLGVDVSLTGVELLTDFPDSLDRIVAFQADNEPAVMGIDAASEERIISLVAPELEEKSSEIVLEYLQRRLLTSLSRSFSGTAPLQCLYKPDEGGDEIEVSGVIHLQLALGKEPAELWLGLGPTLVERFDLAWREQVLKGRGVVPTAGDEGTKVCSIELASFAVSSEMLADYLSAGTTIALDAAPSSTVTLLIDGAKIGRGTLGQANGRFAAVVTQLDSGVSAPSARAGSGTTISVELGRAEIDAAEAAELAQIGAVLLTQSALAQGAQLVISSEPVAAAKLGLIGDSLALQITAK